MFAYGAVTMSMMLPTDDVGLIKAINRDFMEAISKTKVDSQLPHQAIIQAHYW